MISKMCWLPLSCLLIRNKRGYDFFDDFLHEKVTLATPMEIAAYFGNLEFLGELFKHKTEDQNQWGGEISIYIFFRSGSLSVCIYIIYVLIL